MTTADRPVDLQKLRIDSLVTPDVLGEFISGEDEVDRNVEKCCKWHGQYRNRVFCAFLPDICSAVGFYCLGISASKSKYLDQDVVRASGGRAFVPFIYLNYLAVRSEYQNRRIGTLLLLNALDRCALTVKNIGIYGVALHALTDRAAGLYDRYGFREHKPSGKFPFMILPSQSLIDLFS